MEVCCVSIASKYNYVTTKEIQVIETYLANLEKLIDSGMALRILKREFEPTEVSSPRSPGGYYFASIQADKVYGYYKDRYSNKIEKQRLNDYEELKHKATSYCEENGLTD